MPTTRNRGFYCRPYCLLNMFRAPLCPSSGAQQYYTAVAACGISCCKNVKSNFLWNLRSTKKNYKIIFYIFYSTKYHRQQPLYNTLELLMMGILVPETCWASNKICNKNLCYIYLAFYFHILTTMHRQNHIKLVGFLFNIYLVMHEMIHWYYRILRTCLSDVQGSTCFSKADFFNVLSTDSFLTSMKHLWNGRSYIMVKILLDFTLLNCFLPYISWHIILIIFKF